MAGRIESVVIVAAVLVTLGGCGGGSGPATATGAISVSVIFPEPAQTSNVGPGELPKATQSVRIRVLPASVSIGSMQAQPTPAQGVVPDTIIQKGEVGEPVSATITGIPAGDYLVEALGYESLDGTGDVIAQAMVPAQVVAGQTTPLNMITEALVTLVEVNPSELTLRVGYSSQLAATCYDADGNVVIASVAWSSDDPGVAQVSAAGQVTGQAGGNGTVTALEAVSG